MYPVYCINLARRPDRWAHMEVSAKAAGISLIRVEAIDAETLDRTRESAAKAGPVLGAEIVIGDLACSLSHRKAWSMMLDAGHASAAFLEDDCVFADDIAEVFPPDWLPRSAQVVKIETVLRPTRMSKPHPAGVGNRSLARLRARHTGAAGYILRQSAAQLLVEKTETFLDPVDQIIFNPKSALFSQLAPQQLLPAPIIQGQLVERNQTVPWAESSIDASRLDVMPELRDLPKPRMLGSAFEPTEASLLLRRRLRRRLQRMFGLEKRPVPFG